MSSDHVSAPAAYDLTSFTGRKKNAERVFFVNNIEFNLFTAGVLGVSAVVGILVAVALAGLINLFAPGYELFSIVGVGVTVAAGFFFVDTRSKRGLQLRQYRALMDKRTAREAMNHVYVAGEALSTPVVSLHTPQYAIVTPPSDIAPVAGVAVPDTHDESTGKVNLFDA